MLLSLIVGASIILGYNCLPVVQVVADGSNIHRETFQRIEDPRGRLSKGDWGFGWGVGVL